VRRTVEDLAAVLNDDELEIVAESALRQQPTLAFDGAASVQGRTALDRVLARRPAGAPPTESELETRYLQLLRHSDVPPPKRQYQVCDAAGRCLWRLDVCWPEARLWVELDGRGTHTQPAALLSDRHRQNELAVRLHWTPLRFTWDDVTVRAPATVSLTEWAYRSGLGWEGGTARP
jgi:very-short-patch-repair endonuclease